MRDIDRLLRRDVAGQAVADPSDVISAALGDHRHEERVAPLATIMAEVGASPYDRVPACYALAGWGEGAGCAMVVESAPRPRSAPWYGCSVDISDEISAVNGTRTDRVERCGLSSRSPTPSTSTASAASRSAKRSSAVAADVVGTVERGIAALEDVVVGRLPGFPVVLQLVDLASVLTETAESSEAIGLAHRLPALDHSPAALRHAVGFVTRGTGEESLTFGEYLVHIADDEVRADVLETLDFRDRRADRAGGPG